MPWWGWVIVAAMLLGSELLLVDAGFYLVFLGASALIVGLVDLAGFGGEIWQEWAGFAALSLITMIAFRQRIYSQLRGGAEDIPEGVVGEHVLVPQAIEPGGEGRVELRGTTWTAVNAGDRPLEAGSRAHVDRTEGLILYLRPPN
jgi:membrane protein implicated in regulation of membrane protease activity